MASDSGAPFLGVVRSATGRRWRLRSQDDRQALMLAQRAGLPEILGRVLAGRGIDPDALDDFLNPSLRRLLPDPSRFLDMDRAAQRLADAIEKNEPVAVFGDYDVDGATSAALFARAFAALGRPLRLYIPDRIKEGYGPNAPALRKLAAEGIRVVVTVDCGTMAFDALAQGVQSGLDILVVDHHLAEPRLPAVHAVINPNRLDETAGHGQLAAVGVAFLLLVAVVRVLRGRGFFSEREAPDLLGLLDLVALGTVCDVVPITGVNRALVTQGIKVLRGRSNVGLAALADVAGISEPPGAYHIGFLLGPRVNAGGRVGLAELGARLLSSDDPREAQAIAQQLHRYNAERQEIERAVQAEAIADYAAGPTEPGLALVARRGWHPGVIGIVAARLRETAGKPAFVIALDENGIGKGSGRSMPGVDLGAAVVAAGQAGLLVNGGGHAMAAGLTVAADRIGDLRAFLNERLAPQVAQAEAAASLGIDGAISVGAATTDLYDQLERLGPYGAGHAEPRFALTAARVVQADTVGERHVRCLLSAADGQGGRLRAIAFRALDNGGNGASALGEALHTARQTGHPLHLAGHLRADHWRGEKRIQFVVEDAAAPG